MRLLDKLQNLVSGLGTRSDKAVGNKFVLQLLDRAQIDAAYRSDWLARKIIDIIPYDMTRAWRTWQAVDVEIERLEEAERKLGVRAKVCRAMTLARLYGGAAIYIGTGDADPSRELIIESIPQGGIEYLVVLNRYQLTPGPIDLDPLSPHFGEPEHYTITGGGLNASGGVSANVVNIHPSRMIRFIGAELPDPSLANDGWGESILQAVYEAVMQAALAAQSTSSLMNEAKVDVIKVPGLSDHLTNTESTARLTTRFQNAAIIKSMFNMLLLEGDGTTGEAWEQKQIDFTQFPELIRTFFQIASGAADIPVTRLLGQSPAGMNATGDSDIRNYYDRISGDQENTLRPGLDRLDEILLRHSLGERPSEIWYRFAPLWQLSETEKVDIVYKKAQASQIYAVQALVPSVVLEQGIRNQLIDDGVYPGIDAAFEELDLAGGAAPKQKPATKTKTTEPKPGAKVVAIRRTITKDAKPNSLYVSRKVINAGEIVAWAKAQGFGTTVEPADMHVTIAFSRTPVDWFKANVRGPKVEIPAGGARAIERFDGGDVVLLFASDELGWRWQEFRDLGASWDWPEYQPHITFSDDATGVDILAIDPYRGPIVLGPEIFEEIDDDWKAAVAEA